MYASQKFKYMGQNLNKLMMYICSNQNLLRYIKYLDNNPLDPMKSDILDVDVENQIHTLMFNPELLNETKISLFVHPLEGTLEMQPIGEDLYVADIVIPNQFWVLKGKGEMRGFNMAYEIANVIDGKNVAGVGKVEIIRWRSYEVENSYHGLTLWIKVDSITIKT